MLCLAGGAVAQFTVQRLFAAELVLYFSAVAVCFVFDVEVFHVLVHAVRGALLPF